MLDMVNMGVIFDKNDKKTLWKVVNFNLLKRLTNAFGVIYGHRKYCIQWSSKLHPHNSYKVYIYDIKKT